MAKDTKTTKEPVRKRPPAKTPEARENQLIAYAMALVEERLLNGTASSQETTHFLKMGSTKAKAELEILERQKDLMAAKTEAIKSGKIMEELYKKAMSAFSSYSGNPEGDPDEFYD